MSNTQENISVVHNILNYPVSNMFRTLILVSILLNNKNRIHYVFQNYLYHSRVLLVSTIKSIFISVTQDTLNQ